MSLVKLLAQRIVMGLIAAWAVLSIVFALFTLTDDWVMDEGTIDLRWVGADQELIDAVQDDYLAARGLDAGFWENYLVWMSDMVLLNWRYSFLTGEPAVNRVADSLIVTGSYVIPSVIIAIVLGILIGVYVALNPESRIARLSLGSTYLLFALPSFWIGGLLISWTITGQVGYNYTLFNFVLPVLFTTLALLGGYVSYGRAHSMEYASAEFIKLVKAKGGSRWLLAKHVARNSAIPFFSMLFVEALGLLVLAIFVIEVLFGIEGFGLVLFESINERDLPVLLGGTIVIIAIGVIGNIIQDISYSVLDPRVDTGTR